MSHHPASLAPTCCVVSKPSPSAARLLLSSAFGMLLALLSAVLGFSASLPSLYSRFSQGFPLPFALLHMTNEIWRSSDCVPAPALVEVALLPCVMNIRRRTRFHALYVVYSRPHQCTRLSRALVVDIRALDRILCITHFTKLL